MAEETGRSQQICITVLAVVTEGPGHMNYPRLLAFTAMLAKGLLRQITATDAS